eukprot:TRINITY_DN25357_c0_g1_i1.p1 TRINITY_DN25357_c0_g1~~TRINITY_DN25357_c0_g1_i1.p1  ORF type:complete len:145 (+),score=38.48 TRINITY_DN25357_c0_g1_i1:130-564(+)
MAEPDFPDHEAARGTDDHLLPWLVRCATQLPAVPLCVGLLFLSNMFMTFAWYGHLRNMADRHWFYAALASWGIALFEYLLQVPGNRLGYTELSVGQLKIIQECIALTVFVPFSVFYMKEPLRWDYLWAALCMCGAVFFIMRDKL